MIPISRVRIRPDSIGLVEKILKSGNLVQGKYVNLLENNFSRLYQNRYSIAVNNGTSALHTALYAAGIKHNDEVITTPFSFISTSNAILMAGAKPIYIDINKDTFNLDTSLIEKAINNRTRAILYVNLFGLPANYIKLKEIAARYNLILIEDAAQSIGTKVGNYISGCFADISCFSLYATKTLACGEGGLVTTNNPNFFEKAIAFRNHNQKCNQPYNYLGLGYNYRLTEIGAALALTELKRVPAYITKRRKIAHLYNEILKSKSNVITPTSPDNYFHTYHQYTLRLQDNHKYTLQELQNYFYKNNIETKIYYPTPLYLAPHLKKFIRNITDFPHTNQACESVISIPINHNLEKYEIKHITKILETL